MALKLYDSLFGYPNPSPVAAISNQPSVVGGFRVYLRVETNGGSHSPLMPVSQVSSVRYALPFKFSLTGEAYDDGFVNTYRLIGEQGGKYYLLSNLFSIIDGNISSFKRPGAEVFNLGISSKPSTLKISPEFTTQGFETFVWAELEGESGSLYGQMRQPWWEPTPVLGKTRVAVPEFVDLRKSAHEADPATTVQPLRLPVGVPIGSTFCRPNTLCPEYLAPMTAYRVEMQESEPSAVMTSGSGVKIRFSASPPSNPVEGDFVMQDGTLGVQPEPLRSLANPRVYLFVGFYFNLGRDISITLKGRNFKLGDMTTYRPSPGDTPRLTLSGKIVTPDINEEVADSVSLKGGIPYSGSLAVGICGGSVLTPNTLIYFTPTGELGTSGTTLAGICLGNYRPGQSVTYLTKGTGLLPQGVTHPRITVIAPSDPGTSPSLDWVRLD
jgi:hypothetical protein